MWAKCNYVCTKYIICSFMCSINTYTISVYVCKGMVLILHKIKKETYSSLMNIHMYVWYVLHPFYDQKLPAATSTHYLVAPSVTVISSKRQDIVHTLSSSHRSSEHRSNPDSGAKCSFAFWDSSSRSASSKRGHWRGGGLLGRAFIHGKGFSRPPPR